MTTKLTDRTNGSTAEPCDSVNGRYRILETLGQGGQGRVFRVADQFQAGRIKVLKALPGSADPEAAERLRWEFVRLARLDHPRLLRVFDLDVADGSGPLEEGQVFFTAEFSGGRHPAEIIAKLGKRRRVELLWRIAVDVASALDHIHGKGLLHGDVKPENLLCTSHGDVKLIDLGLSTVAGNSGTDEVRGTLDHLAPEALAGVPDERADLYGLGSTLYFLATGRLARGMAGDHPEGLAATIEALMRQEPEPLASLADDLPRGLCGVVDGLVARDPDDRPRSARVLVEQIARTRRTVSLALSDEDEGLGLLATGLVGRGALVQDIRRVVGARLRSDAVPDGAPAVVVLRGEEGAGRTATLDEVIRQIQLRVARGDLTSPRVATGVTLAQAVRPLVSGAPPSLADDAGLAEVITLLEEEAAERPMVIVVQDGDADANVLRRLFRVFRRDPRLTLGHLALVVRASVGLALEAEGIALERTLPPLTAEEVQTLVTRCLGSPPPGPLVERLRDASGGLPGLVLELVRAAWTEVGDRRRVAEVDVDHLTGEGLQEVAAARLAHLPARERHLALGLAVAGEAIPLEWSASLVDLSPAEAWEAIEVLQHHGVVTVADGHLRLAHPSYGEALEATPEEVAGLHGLLARQYQALARAGDDTALIAQVSHLAAAPPDPTLPDLAREAADRSSLRGQWAQAARLLDIARRAQPAAKRRATTLALALALVRSGAYDEGLAEVDGLKGKVTAAERLEAATVRGLALQRRGGLTEAREILTDALARQGRGKVSARLKVEAQTVLGRVLLALGDLDSAGALCPEVDSAPAFAGGLGLLEIGGLARFYAGDLEAAQAFFDRAADRATAEDPARLSRALGFAGMVHQTAGRLTRAERCFEEASRLAEQQHDLHGAALYAGNLGGVLREQGRPAEALEPSISAVRRMIQLGRTAELPAYVFNLGNLLLDLGDLDGAYRELALMATEVERVGAPLMRGYMLLLCSDLLRRANHQGRRLPGDLPELVRGRRPARLAQEAAEVFADIGASRQQAYACIEEVECRAAEGRPERAGTAIATLETLVADLDDPLVTHLASLARGRLGLAGAPGHQSEHDLAAAFDFFADGHAERAWRVEVVRGGLALGRGDEAEARRRLASAMTREQAQRERLPEAYRSLRDQDADLALGARLRRQVDGVESVSHTTAGLSGTPGPEPDAVQLRRLLSINQRINSERRLPILLELVLDAVLELTDAERGFILLLSEDDVLQVRIARNMDRQNLAEGEFSLSQSIAEQAARQGEAVITVDAAMDERFSSAVSVHGLRIRSVLAVPLRVKGRVVGTVYVDNRLRRGAFSDGDLALVRDFAQQAAIAIENARLTEELQDRQAEIERLNEELASKVARQEAEIQDMRTELRQNQAALQVRYDYSNIVGATPPMTELFHLLDRITDVELPVVIHGESGTGKELVARAIHVNGPRKERAFVSENCGALPETLLESILFGHVKGAFTGADREKRGLFEVAHGGTLFLDEVGEMSPAMQTKLLRVLQDGEVRRVGGDKVIRVDVRILAASNQNLADLVASKRFRQDLFYRLNVLQVVLPPLRERAPDVVLLVEHFIGKYSPGRPRRVARAAMDRLMAYNWPGNVRELENEVQRALALGGDLLGLEDLTAAVRGEGPGPGMGKVVGKGSDDMDLRSHVEGLERDLLHRALERTGNNQTRAAALLGLSRFGLLKKLKRYGMVRSARKAG